MPCMCWWLLNFFWPDRRLLWAPHWPPMSTWHLCLEVSQVFQRLQVNPDLHPYKAILIFIFPISVKSNYYWAPQASLKASSVPSCPGPPRQAVNKSCYCSNLPILSSPCSPTPALSTTVSVSFHLKHCRSFGTGLLASSLTRLKSTLHEAARVVF